MTFGEKLAKCVKTKMVENCEYDEMIRDRLVVGISLV